MLVLGQLGTPGSVKIADFGFARVMQSLTAAAPAGTRADLAVSSLSRQGTPLWRAPELFGSVKKARTPDSLSDLYALGVLFWEVVTRSPPYATKVLPSLYDVSEFVKDEDGRPDSEGCATPAAAKTFLWSPAPLQALTKVRA